MSYHPASPRVYCPESNLRGYLLATAATDPGRPAVAQAAEGGGLETVSYGELRQRTDALAARLDELGLDVGDRVIVESDSSADAIAMLLACSSLGLAFITVSPKTPLARLRFIMDAAQPALHAQPGGGDRDGLPEQVGAVRFGPDGLTVIRPPRPRARYRREITGTDPAYIVFTSGTTGRPKGVVMSHRGVISFLRGALGQGIVAAGSRVATTSPLQFDFAIGDVGLTLGGGATVIPVPRSRVNWPRHLIGFLRETGATQVHGVPSIWRQALRHAPDELAGLTGLRCILFSGEEFPLPELRQLQALLPAVRIINCYGATESMACSFTEVPSPLGQDVTRLSIGRAHPGAEMMLADEAGQPITEPGRTGEIYLRSPALFSGYWDDPAATRAVLVPDPLNPRSGQIVFRTGDLAYLGAGGELYFCGRADTQVQVRGNRVELAEVDRRIMEFPGVAAAAALVLPGSGEEGVLHAFVVPKSADTKINQKVLRNFCLETLPDYMAPQGIRIIDEIPLTENGKIDRARLSSIAVSGPA